MIQTRKILIILFNLLLFWGALPLLLYLAGRGLDLLMDVNIESRLVRYAGLLLALPGLYLCTHAMFLLKNKGQGLPISALGPTRLVTDGPYRIYRHPIYAGFIYCASGIGLFLGSPGMVLAAAAFAAIWFNTWVRLYEEPGLYRRFGADYRAYRRKTTVILPFRIRTVMRRMILLLFKLFFHVTIEGRQHVPARGPMIFVTDHLSYLDFMLGHFLHPALTVIPVSAEVFRKPLQRLFMGIIMGGVPKRRFCRDAAANLAVMDELRSGGVIGIAVEGERSWTGEMSLPSLSVARNLIQFDCPLIPVAFTGSYRLWPRWSGSSDRPAPVTVRIGNTFNLSKIISGQAGGDAAAAARIIKARIESLRLPDEASVDITRYRNARPELVLWRCPVCRREACLSFTESRWLTCAICKARWDGRGGDLTLVEPLARAGEKKTIAGWCRKAGSGIVIPRSSNKPILAAEAELREDPDASITMHPLRSLGMGKAILFKNRIAWGHGVEQREYPISKMYSVTTERNDTLQMGIGRGAVQLVFDAASPLQWQTYLMKLAPTRRSSGDGDE